MQTKGIAPVTAPVRHVDERAIRRALWEDVMAWSRLVHDERRAQPDYQALSVFTGISASLLRKKVDPYYEGSACLCVETILKVSIATAGRRGLGEFCRQIDGVFVETAVDGVGMSDLGALAVAFGQTCQTISRAVAPDSPGGAERTPDEARAIRADLAGIMTIAARMDKQLELEVNAK